MSFLSVYAPQDYICCVLCELTNCPLFFLNHRLDYPGVGPEHSFLKDIGRAEYDSVTDQEALDGMSRSLSIVCYWLNYFSF